jgi:hypothetical protein
MINELDFAEPVDLKEFRGHYSLINETKTVVFSINRIKDEETGQLYSGEFEFKLFLTLKERGLVAASTARRNFGIDPTDFTYAVNKAVCELQVKCVKCPDWFKDDNAFEIVGLQPIDRVFSLVKAAQEEYRENMNNR